MAVLIGMSSTVKGRKFELNQDEIFVGRNHQNQVSIEDTSISGRHCSIVRDDHRYTLVDLGSTNGTRLNGTSVVKAALKPKDIIQVGNVELMFDGQDVMFDESAFTATTRIPRAPSMTAQIEVMAEPVHVPADFRTASPFGARKDSRKAWVILTIILLVLVVGALVFFVSRIFGAA